MLLATVATWGHFKLGYVCRAVWIGRRQGSSKWEAAASSFHLAAITHHWPETRPCMGCQARLGPWQPRAVCVSWSSSWKPFSKSCVKGLWCSSAADCELIYTSAWWGHADTQGFWRSRQALHRPCPILREWCRSNRGHTSPSNGSCIAQGSPNFDLAPLLPISLLLDVTDPNVSHIPWWAGFRKTCCSRWFW